MLFLYQFSTFVSRKHLHLAIVTLKIASQLHFDDKEWYFRISLSGIPLSEPISNKRTGTFVPEFYLISHLAVTWRVLANSVSISERPEFDYGSKTGTVLTSRQISSSKRREIAKPCWFPHRSLPVRGRRGLPTETVLLLVGRIHEIASTVYISNDFHPHSEQIKPPSKGWAIAMEWASLGIWKILGLSV